MPDITFSAPHGAAWTLAAVMVVVWLGPRLAEAVRLPGIIGLLAGGWLIGPYGLDIVQAANTTVPDLGQLGLLYLMFLAGAELDLDVVRRNRLYVLGFSLLTFLIPLSFGLGSALLLGYGMAAAWLFGSMWASHTLLTYPVVREAGLAGNRAVAVAVGATAIADTLALVVLAAVAGYATGEASGLDLGAQLVVGLVILAVASIVALPVAARLFFQRFGHEAPLRYAFVVSALLAGAVLAEVVGIEGIVGAFFAGLGLNRALPNEGPLFERLEFYGSAFLIPVFLVSVGLIIDPSVMIEPRTIGLAAVFTAAVLGGKLLAAALCRPLFGYSWGEAGVVFSLTSAQAAATLATTFVGLRVGLIGTSVVNAVLIVILVSVVVAGITAARASRRVPPAKAAESLGRSVLLVVHDGGPIRPAVAFAQRLAAPDGGVVLPVVASLDGRPPAAGCEPELRAAIAQQGIDCEIARRSDRSLADLVRHTLDAEHGTGVVVPMRAEDLAAGVLDAGLRDLFDSSPVPVFAVAADQPIAALQEVTPLPTGDGEVFEHLRRSGLTPRAAGGRGLGTLLRFPRSQGGNPADLIQYLTGKPLARTGGRSAIVVAGAQGRPGA